jgi:hypothetical protein
MGFFTNLEKAAASKLKSIFLDAKSLVDASETEIANLEAKLAAEKQKIADLAQQAHQAALAAAEKAKKEAEDLIDAAYQAGLAAEKHLANVPQPVEPTVTVQPTTEEIVEPTVTAQPTTEAQADPNVTPQ